MGDTDKQNTTITDSSTSPPCPDTSTSKLFHKHGAMDQIPQMIVTSADEIDAAIKKEQELNLPDVIQDESTADIFAKEENEDERLLEQYTHRAPLTVGPSSKSGVEDVALSNLESKSVESISITTVQRPLLIDSEKPVSETETCVGPGESSVVAVSTPSHPTGPSTASQRPLVFSGSTAQEEAHHEQSDKTPIPREDAQEKERSLLVPEAEVLPDTTKSQNEVPPTKQKSSGFSWMPSFPKLHASGKEVKHPNETSQQVKKEIADTKCTEPTAEKKEGLHGVRKFFDSVFHETHSDPKVSEPHKEALSKADSGEKKAPKEGRHGIKSFFTPQVEPPKEKKNVSFEMDVEKAQETDTNKEKEKKKDEDLKHNIMKKFDFFKHEHASDKKQKWSHQMEDDKPEDKPHKDPMHGIRKFFDSFKSDTDIPDKSSSGKDIECSSETTKPYDAQQSTTLDPGLQMRSQPSTSSEQAGPVAEKKHKDPKDHKEHKDLKDHKEHKDPKHHKEQKDPKEHKDHKEHKDPIHGIKKFFDSFKQEEDPNKKVSIVQTPNSTESGICDKVTSDTAHGVKAEQTVSDITAKEVPKVQENKNIITKDTVPTTTKVDEKPKPKESRFKKFFDSFRHDESALQNVHLEKSSVNGNSLKRSSSFKEDTLTRKNNLSEPGVAKIEDLKVENKRSSIRRTQSFKEAVSEKGHQSIKGFFDSFTHTSASKPSSQVTQPSYSMNDEHIYDYVGKADEPLSSESSKKSTSKHGQSGVKKMFDSLLHKEPAKHGKIANAEKILAKVDISSEIESGIKIRSMSNSAEQAEIEIPKIQIETVATPEHSKEAAKTKSDFEKIPPTQVNEPSTSTTPKTSMLDSISDNLMAFKDKLLPPKEPKKKENVVVDEVVFQEYDLQNPIGQENEFPEETVGTFKKIDNDYFDDKSREKNLAPLNDKIPKQESSKATPTSSKIAQLIAKKPVIRCDDNAQSSSPETLYDTCCLQLGALLHKKDGETSNTKSPPSKPPKPTAEAIAKARAAVISKRLTEIQSKGLSVGATIPVGYDGIRFADDETESSCDYKDLENLDYIVDYNLATRFKSNKEQFPSDPSSGSARTSYYSVDTNTLRDSIYSDALMETVSLGSNDSYHIASDEAASGYDKSYLKSSKPKSDTSGNLKKVPPPLPPKPILSPQLKARLKKNAESLDERSLSECINSLSLSPRNQSKFSKDPAATQQRPLMVAGLKGTEFSSLKLKTKEDQRKSTKDRMFNTVLKNESLKKINLSTTKHAPLTGTKSSPSLLTKTVSPSKPVSSVVQKPSVKPKPATEGDQVCLPQRPPPPAKKAVVSPPPRPPPPKKPSKIPTPQTQKKVEATPSFRDYANAEPFSYTQDLGKNKSYALAEENAQIRVANAEKEQRVMIQYGQNDINGNFAPCSEDVDIFSSDLSEHSTLTLTISEDEKPQLMADREIPKPPPRMRRFRSRTVETPTPREMVEPTPRRSQSLTELDIQQRMSYLNISTAPRRPDSKHIYTVINKDRKKSVTQDEDYSNLDNSNRPLPPPPAPPRKFRSLDRPPKVKEKLKVEPECISENPVPPDLKPPARKKRDDNRRFHSLSTDRKKTHPIAEDSSKLTRSASSPMKPARKQRHPVPEYDENANFSFPVLAEIHPSPSTEIRNTVNSRIPTDSVDSRTINLPPRQSESKNQRVKSHSSWYDETYYSRNEDDPWELVDWDPKHDSENKFTPYSRVPMRRQSDPVPKTAKTSKFYVNLDIETKMPSVNKETSPLPLEQSEKSVQTSLETLSQGRASPVEGDDDDTDELLGLAHDLQNQLQAVLDRHKSLSNVDKDSSNTPVLSSAESEKNAIEPRHQKMKKTHSNHSSTSELWPVTSSDESDGVMPPETAANLSEIAQTRKQKKIFYIAREIMTSEEVFVDTLKLLNVDFRAAVEDSAKQKSAFIVPDEIINQIFNHLPQLQHLNENLLAELKDRIQNWETIGKISDIIVRTGPFLKLYSWYIHDFESNVGLLEDSKKRFPLFAQVVKDFEASARCKKLTINWYMLKPIQRIPQYRLLLQEYLHQLTEESPDYQDTVAALQIVSEVANHANDSMKHGDNAQKLISIQNSIMGHREIIKPGRIFVKEGELMKLSRKEMQPRWFVLFNDILLYLTPVQQGLYRVNYELALTGMKIAIPVQQDYQNEFSIISVTRSFTLAAKTQEERQEWIIALSKAIEENASKRSTFTNIRLQQKAQAKTSEEEGEFVLGKTAPVWIPDARVTMCQLCTSEFTVTFRRHHCRACGKVICSICSSYRKALPYLNNRVVRICDECHSKLGQSSSGCTESADTDSENQQLALKPHLRTENRHAKKGKRFLPSVLKEVCANDQGSTISGCLHKRNGKSWKRDWFVVKDKVLYEYRASEDVAALRSIPLLGYQIEPFNEPYENIDSSLLFQLAHPGQAPIIFYADTIGSTERWITALKEASVLE